MLFRSARRRETIASLLVMIGSPRLGRANMEVPVSEEEALSADRRLYRLLEPLHGDATHSQYNALIRRLVSFERALSLRGGADCSGISPLPSSETQE